MQLYLLLALLHAKLVFFHLEMVMQFPLLMNSILDRLDDFDHICNENALKVHMHLVLPPYKALSVVVITL